MTSEHVQRLAEWLTGTFPNEEFQAEELAADALDASGATARIEELEVMGRKEFAAYQEALARAEQVEKRVEELQQAINEVGSTLHSSANVGGPSERDAWRRVLEIVAPLEIHKAQASEAALSQAQQSEPS